MLELGRDLFLLLLLLPGSQERTEVLQDILPDAVNIRDDLTDLPVFFCKAREKMADGIQGDLGIECT